MNDRRLLMALALLGILLVAGFGTLYYLRPGVEDLEAEVKELRAEVQKLDRRWEERNEVLRRSGLTLADSGAIRTWKEPSRPIASLAVLPVHSDQVSVEVTRLNQNLTTLLRDNLGIKVLLPDKEFEGGNPLATGKMLGADGVLFGEAFLIPFLSDTEYVQLNLQEVTTGNSIWSYRLILRKGGDKDRSDIPLKLQNLPGEVTRELKARWPK